MSVPPNALKPDQAFIDKHMSAGLMEAMRNVYALKNDGAIIVGEELRAFIATIPDPELLAVLKAHPSAPSNPAFNYSDAQVLAWVRS